MQLSIWQKFLSNGLESSDRNEVRKIIFTNFFSTLGIITMVASGVVHLARTELTLATVELLGAVTTLINLINLRFSKDVDAAIFILLLTLYIELFSLIMTGGTQHTGFIWFTTFPIVSYFLSGKKLGSYWIAFLFLTLIVVNLSQFFGLFSIAYSRIEMRQLIGCIIVITGLTYLYESDRTRKEEESLAYEKDLKDYIDNMSTFSAKLSPVGTILLANRSVKETSGLGERLIGQNFLEQEWWRYDPSVHARVTEAFKQSLLGKVVNYQENFRAANGAVLRINFSLIPVYRDKRLQYVLAEAKDITEITQAEASLIKQAEELRRLNKIMVGRELRMVELKREIGSLKKTGIEA